jgi:hypothetical protein
MLPGMTALAFLASLMMSCSSPQKAGVKPGPAPAPATAPASALGSSAPAGRCVPPGDYAVKVDLSSAQITQRNTGMEDTEWCRSILEAVPAQSMGAMRISYTGDKLAVTWPNPASLVVRSECAFEITSPPMPTRISFSGGEGTGTTTYSIGTPNHPDESCTATGARLSIEPAAGR